MLLSSKQKRELDKQGRRIDAGFPGLIALDDIYGFGQFLTTEREWHSSVTSGNELLHVYWHTREIVVSYSETKHRTVVHTLIDGRKCGSQHGMSLYYAYTIFYKQVDD